MLSHYLTPHTIKIFISFYLLIWWRHRWWWPYNPYTDETWAASIITYTEPTKQEIWANAYDTRARAYSCSYYFAGNLSLSPSLSSQFTLLQPKIATCAGFLERRGSGLKLLKIYIQCWKFHTQVVLVYLQPFRRNSFLKCGPQPEIAKNSLKPLFWGFKVI